MLWILDHKRDVMADLRVLAGVSWRDALAWPGPELLAVIYRLAAYGGMISSLVAERESRRPGRRPGAKSVPGTRLGITSDATLRHVVSFGGG